MNKVIHAIIFLLSTSFSFGQIETLIPGTYIWKQEKGAHFVPGLSFGDTHPTSYISSVDTTITTTIVLDSLYNATFTRDTSFYMRNTALGPVKTKMTGTWSVKDDTLTIQYSTCDTVYPSIATIDTITGTANGIESEIIPDKLEKHTPMKMNLYEKFKLLILEDTRYLGSEDKKITKKWIYAILPINKKESVEYRKQ